MLAQHVPHASHRQPQGLVESTRWGEHLERPAGFLREGEPFPELTDDILGDRFRSWRGASGRRYIFSVFDSSNCPAYCEAVLIAVVIEDGGHRRPIAMTDTGTFPEPVVARMTRTCCAVANRLEFHMHLLANSVAERRFILEDLQNAA